MRSVLTVWCVCAAIAAGTAQAADPKPVTYQDDVKPILREHCFKCHGDDERKADLNLQSFAAILKGGSGGEIVKAGRPGSSVLYQALAHEGDAAPMPPKGPKIPDAQIAVVRLWIEQGVRESASSKSLAPQRRTVELAPAAVGKPVGPPAMPGNLPTVTLPAQRRPMPITALATSPWAPLLAVAGYEHISLINTDTRLPLGTLPFPEGVPYVLRFSRDGTLLLAAGGRPVNSGKAVLFDVKSGKRIAELGDELDAILAADISADQQLVAIGGSGKLAKVYATRTGALEYKLDKHTDWITFLEFSPDGKRLATGDRNGAIHLWEAKSGGILLSLSEHKESILAMNWRGDGQLLATGAEDGRLILWDTQDGWPASGLSSPHVPKQVGAKKYGKVPSGVLSVQFMPDGGLLTSGRDGAVGVWNAGGGKIATFETPGALPTKVAVSADGTTIIAGDSLGVVHYWTAPGTKAPAR